ncbi:MAG: ribosome biogenesis GTPase Der [Myxococcota bacterium]|nr:ribosome biogenesis GTPase Der [Myxococcota bacterium]
MEASQLPIVAIVGRPNVGKSTLFNRYAGRRRAIVEDRPGLTRDRIAEEVEVGGRRILLVDTAGLEPGPAEGLPAAVQAQARAAMEQADAVLFVVDGRAGLTAGDEEIAATLRRGARPLLLLVNKIDGPSQEDRAVDFYRLGLEPLRTASAEHGRGAWDALEELVERIEPAPAPAPETEADPESLFRVALVGRPNVGKSSLLNRLAGAERAVVSDEAGTTRDAVDTRIEREDGTYLVVDTAGLRRQGRRDRVGERAAALVALRAIERAEVALVVVDGSAGFTERDVHVAGMVRDRGCAAAVVVNKWDLVDTRDGEGAEALRAEVARRLRFAPDTPIVTVSALTGQRVERLFGVVRRLAGAARTRIPTAALNRWLQQAVETHEPAMAQRGPRKRPVRFFYATQVGVRPPSFALFCTEPAAVRDSYRRYLENRLRERFELAGTPVRLHLRSRRE